MAESKRIYNVCNYIFKIYTKKSTKHTFPIVINVSVFLLFFFFRSMEWKWRTTKEIKKKHGMEPNDQRTPTTRAKMKKEVPALGCWKYVVVESKLRATTKKVERHNIFAFFSRELVKLEVRLIHPCFTYAKHDSNNLQSHELCVFKYFFSLRVGVSWWHSQAPIGRHRIDICPGTVGMQLVYWLIRPFTANKLICFELTYRLMKRFIIWNSSTRSSVRLHFRVPWF